jgi:hypothetical protein
LWKRGEDRAKHHAANSKKGVVGKRGNTTPKVANITASQPKMINNQRDIHSLYAHYCAHQHALSLTHALFIINSYSCHYFALYFDIHDIHFISPPLYLSRQSFEGKLAGKHRGEAP